MQRAPRLRHARLSDSGQLSRLEVAAFTGPYARHRFSESQIRYYLEDARSIAHVAVVGTTVVGYSLGVQHTGRLVHLSRLHSIAVLPSHRGHGLSSRLLAAFLSASKKRGCRVSVLEVAASNRKAIGLFTRFGFRVWKSLPDYYGRRIDGLRMRLQLTIEGG
jgi:[ribosomal protein S18]-alanine N-acetyltransferase